MRRFFSNMTIRASLLWVLVFFSLMLILGAVLGVVSMRVADVTMRDMRRSQAISNVLQDVVGDYKSAMIGLGRAAALHLNEVIKQVSQPAVPQVVPGDLAKPAPADPSDPAKPVQADAGDAAKPVPAPPSVAARPMPTSLSDAAKPLVDFARISYDKAQTDFKKYQALPKPAGLENEFKEIDQAFAALMDQGLKLMFDDLAKADMPAYQTHAQMVSDVMEDRLNLAIGQYMAWRLRTTNDAFDQSEQRYNLVLIAVAAGGVIALLLVLATYMFLRKRVVRPLADAAHHFDRIAAGDLTEAVDDDSTNEIGALYGAMRRMQESLTRTVSAVRRGVDEINVGAREISAGNTDLSSRTEQQAASLEETAASMEELAS
ncbi:MAG TPA: Tar ligand binding domain-containing protein, partial [Bordetella sp.]|nr:Tar ligand binding domain-containing protein [Bordetella sp.]